MTRFRVPLGWSANGPPGERTAGLPAGVLLVLWAAIVAVTANHHEFWRDEISALTLALRACSLFTVPVTVHGEGHPGVWYMLLRAAHDVFGTKAVLPVVAAAIAGIAVILFLWRAPFPVWWKALFVFSGLPLYEYSVMARNYGISMLLLFLFALVYTRARPSPLLLGGILFLLANTNIHSVILMPLLLLIWCWDFWKSRGKPGPGSPSAVSTSLGMILAMSGILACFLTIYPSKHDLYAQTYLNRSLIASTSYALAMPGRYFGELLPVWPRYDLLPYGKSLLYGKYLLVTAVLYLSVIGLVSRIPLFIGALVGLWMLSFFFSYVYAGDYRHQGILVVFLITLYWIALHRRPTLDIEKRLSKTLPAALYVVLPAILLSGVAMGVLKTSRDIERPASHIKSVAELLRSSADLSRAIVVAEPDYGMEALAYYADNDTYLLREDRFGNTVIFTKRAKLDLRLSDILRAANELKARTGRPIVVMLSHRLIHVDEEREISFSYGWKFRYSEDELREFDAATTRLASFRNAYTDENFEVYTLK